MANDDEAPITDDDIRKIAEQIQATEDTWLSAQQQTIPVVSCPECGGSGSLDHGSLGAGCYMCNGRGTVTDEFAEGEPLQLPPELRQVRLDFKHIAGLLDSASAAKRAGRRVKCPTRRDAARLLAGVAKLPEMKEQAKAIVRKHRQDSARTLEGAQDRIAQLEGEISRLKRGQLKGRDDDNDGTDSSSRGGDGDDDMDGGGYGSLG